MSEQRIVIKAERLHPVVAWTAAFSQALGTGLSKGASWAASTAQRSGSVVAVLMGPAVLSVYVFAVWSLTADLGWTDSFPFASGPLSSWIIWTGLAIAIHCASVILKKQKDRN